jgi:hypothetical protein
MLMAHDLSIDYIDRLLDTALAGYLATAVSAHLARRPVAFQPLERAQLHGASPLA